MTDTVDTERRRFYRDLALLLGLPFLVAVGMLALWRPWQLHYDVAVETDVYAVISGEWDWATADGFCEKNPHTISFSPDRKLMTILHEEPWTDSAGVTHRAAEYDLEQVSRHHVRGRIRGETRLTAAGQPVVWDLVLTSPNSYRWQRTDWPFWGYTPEVRRCPSDADSTSARTDSFHPRSGSRSSTGMERIAAGQAYCALCGEVIRRDEDAFVTPDFLADEAHPFWRFADAPMHRTCFRFWERRKGFIACYNQLARRWAGGGPYLRMTSEGELVRSQ